MLRLVPALLYMALIFYLSSQPAPNIGVSDKTLHFVAYGLLALLLLWGLLGIAPFRGAALLSLVLTALYGASDEWHQSYVPGRSPELLDVAADAAGGLAVLLLVAGARSVLLRRRNEA